MQDHTPTPSESATISDLVERYRFEFVPIRLTATMLAKSIMDARAPLRELLAAAGIVDFQYIPQGTAFKQMHAIKMAAQGGVSSRNVSFYRPESKQGDPRIWIERLSSACNAGDLLLFTFSELGLGAIVLHHNGTIDLDAPGEFLPSRFEQRSQWEHSVSTLMQRIEPLRDRWHRTLRAGPTGVGYTFESLLGIAANTKRGPDFRGIELKASRHQGGGKGRLITLFSQVPVWTFPGKGEGLLSRYGYEDKRGRRSLYCTIRNTPNTLAFRLDLGGLSGHVLVRRAAEEAMRYQTRTLLERLREKHPATLFVKAATRGSGQDEEFFFDRVTLRREPSAANFLDLILDDAVGLDLTMHLKPSGGARDHGYLWRILEPRLKDLFAYSKVLVG